MIASNGRGIIVMTQAFAVALLRARERLMGLCAAALGTDDRGLRRVIAHGDGAEMRRPEIPGASWQAAHRRSARSPVVWASMAA
jgi:hypothetical protein